MKWRITFIIVPIGLAILLIALRCRQIEVLPPFNGLSPNQEFRSNHPALANETKKLKEAKLWQDEQDWQ